MTNDILQSDIELARKLLDANCASDEIVAALSYRGIKAERAAHLIADLQDGKTVEADRPIQIRLQSAKTQETAPAPQTQRQKSAGSDLSGERERKSRHRKVNAFPWFTVMALTAACVCVAVFVLLSRKSHLKTSINQETSQESKHTPSVKGTGGFEGGIEATAISVEVEAAGLRLCGNPVARENFLATIFKILGAPARTNEMEKAEQVIYVYDACGLLVYAPKDAGHCSIVLDFDGSDGAAGTKTAFVGTCKINKQDVRANTQAASLAAMKELGLEPPKSASGILRGRYGSVDLLFGYLKNPARLNLIEIDFK
jgi:hypothetical protein